MLANFLGEFCAALGGEFFGVVQADDSALGVENDRGGDDGAKQRATAGFVETRNARPAEFARRSLKTGRAESAHTKEEVMPGAILARKTRRTLVFRQANTLTAHVHTPRLPFMEVKISPELQAKLERIAEQQGRDSESLVNEALEHFVGHQEWFVREVETGLAQVRDGKTLPHEDVVSRMEALITKNLQKK
jgi:predicted transcriptional regulator